MIRERIQIRFRKQGDLRLISHRDLARTWERWLRRADVRLSMSEGFHPRPRINFLSALGLGIVGLDELVEIDLSETRTPESVLAALEPVAPPGLEICSVKQLPIGAPRTRVGSVVYEQQVPAHRQAATQERIAWLLAQSSFLIERVDRQAPLELRTSIQELTLADGTLKLRLAVDPQGMAKPREVFKALGLEDLALDGPPLVRKTVELAL